MADTLLPYALTTPTRVKNRLTITSAGFDGLLLSLVNSVTDFIEGECNRRFLETTYTQQIYSVPVRGQKFIILHQAPVSSISAFEYRAGLKSNPSWTAFYIDDWELLEDGSSGIIEIHGNLIHGFNTIRASYVAGYKIDFTHYGDMSNHTLPTDLTDLAERLVVRLFKRRELGGKHSESVQRGSSIEWKDDLDNEDNATLARYRRQPTFA